jgi:hypothetical protein
MEDFVHVAPAALPAPVCDELVARFDAHPEVGPGLAGGRLDPRVKRSRDLSLLGRADFADLVAPLLAATRQELLRYVRLHPFVVLAGSSFARRDSGGGEPRPLTPDDLVALPDDELAGLLQQVFRVGELNMQHYARGEGGYFAWHAEVSPGDPTGEPLHRVLPFMVYLNDVAEGGETEWHYQRLRIQPRRGTLVMWPAYFTHTHRGLPPASGDKYIVTSWILYQRARPPSR